MRSLAGRPSSLIPFSRADSAALRDWKRGQRPGHDRRSPRTPLTKGFDMLRATLTTAALVVIPATLATLATAAAAPAFPPGRAGRLEPARRRPGAAGRGAARRSGR